MAQRGAEMSHGEEHGGSIIQAIKDWSPFVGLILGAIGTGLAMGYKMFRSHLESEFSRQLAEQREAFHAEMMEHRNDFRKCLTETMRQHISDEKGDFEAIRHGEREIRDCMNHMKGTLVRLETQVSMLIERDQRSRSGDGGR